MGIIKENSTNFPSNVDILIDTNVIYWLTYASSRSFPKTLKPQSYQLAEYPRLFEKIIKNNNRLYYSDFSTPELLSIIVRIEASLDGIDNRRDVKKWLRDKGRNIVYKEIEPVLLWLESVAQPLTQQPLSSREYHKRYGEVYLDGYDIYIEDGMTKNKISYVLTDDIDFTSITNCNVITANKSV